MGYWSIGNDVYGWRLQVPGAAAAAVDLPGRESSGAPALVAGDLRRGHDVARAVLLRAVPLCGWHHVRRWAPVLFHNFP